MGKSEQTIEQRLAGESAARKPDATGDTAPGAGDCECACGDARAGVESFSPLGERFDPALHEAMATAKQPADGAESGTIVEVYQPGYRLGQTIIRPARVVVAA